MVDFYGSDQDVDDVFNDFGDDSSFVKQSGLEEDEDDPNRNSIDDGILPPGIDEGTE
jgi:hypothetical protein